MERVPLHPLGLKPSPCSLQPSFVQGRCSFMYAEWQSASACDIRARLRSSRLRTGPRRWSQRKHQPVMIAAGIRCKLGIRSGSLNALSENLPLRGPKEQPIKLVVPRHRKRPNLVWEGVMQPERCEPAQMGGSNCELVKSDTNQSPEPLLLTCGGGHRAPFRDCNTCRLSQKEWRNGMGMRECSCRLR